MATIGLSKPYYALYNYDSEARTVSYTEGGLLGKFTELSLELEGGSTNILYADNGPAESDQTFSGGTITITTDELNAAVMLPILGLKAETMNVDGVTTEDAKWIVYDDDQVIPYVGLGGILKKKVNGVTKWVAFVLDKGQFSNPGLSAVTQGESIEWQTSSLSANIMRSDNDTHTWRRISSFLNTEAEAEAAVKAYLGITAPTNSAGEDETA